MPASSDNLEKLGAMVMLAGLAVGMLILVGGAKLGSSLSAAVPNITDNYLTGSSTSQVCDLAGSIQGSVHDDNHSVIQDKYVTVTSVNTSVVASSCHTKNIVDLFRLFDLAVPSLPKGAAMGGGTVDITVGLYNSFGQQVSAKTFTITTENSQIDKPFYETVGVRSLDAGQSYVFKVFTSWSPNALVYAKSIAI